MRRDPRDHGLVPDCRVQIQYLARVSCSLPLILGKLQPVLPPDLLEARHLPRFQSRCGRVQLEMSRLDHAHEG